MTRNNLSIIWISLVAKSQYATKKNVIGPILFLYYKESLVSSNLNSKLFWFHGVRPNESTGWNNHTPLNNFCQNIENLAYFENVLKTLLDGNFDFFFKKYWKKNLETSKINKSTIWNKNAQARCFLKKNKQTCSFIWYSSRQKIYFPYTLLLTGSFHILRHVL